MHQIKTEKYKGFFPLRVALAALALAGLVTLIFWQMKIHDKQEELASLKAQITAQDTKNDAIRETVRSLENEEGLSQYAENKARKDLDYAKSGERIFVDVGGSD